MRRADRRTAVMFSYVSPEGLVPVNHPLRAIRPLVSAALGRLSPRFDKIYARAAGLDRAGASVARVCCAAIKVRMPVNLDEKVFFCNDVRRSPTGGANGKTTDLKSL